MVQHFWVSINVSFQLFFFISYSHLIVFLYRVLPSIFLSLFNMISTMLEVVFHPTPKPHTTIHRVPIPSPGPNEVVIKVHVASSNPKDWIHPIALGHALNSGDDLAGTVHAVGTLVEGKFKVGERVAAFHPMGTPHGAYAEFAVAPSATVVRIPARMTFEEAATIPLNSTTAAITLFRRQEFNPPWNPEGPATQNQGPIVIYGASSALGTFAVKLCKLADIHPIIAIGGGSASYTRKFLDSGRGDSFIDYRGGVDAMKQQILDSVGGGSKKPRHAIDCISQDGTWIPLAQILDGESRSLLSVTNGAHRYDDDSEIPPGVTILYTYVGTAHTGKYPENAPRQPPADAARADVAFARDFFSWLGRMLEQDGFEGHPYQVVSGGLAGVEEGLRRLRESGNNNNNNKGRKLVYRIAEETPFQK